MYGLSPELDHKLPGTYESEAGFYNAVLATIRSDIDTFPGPARDGALSFFDRLAQGEFAQVVALLPFWLSDVAPVATGVVHSLGVAHLYGWWYYAVQDDLLDGAAEPETLLWAHIALLRMVEIYRRLGVADAPCWREFEKLNVVSASWYAQEIGTRFAPGSPPVPDRAAQYTIELVVGRSSPFYFNTLAQLYLAGVPAGDRVQHHVLEALRCFVAVRQICDDARDWTDDLRRGCFNTVSAAFVRYLAERNLIEAGVPLDIERLLGQQIVEEPFWRSIELTALNMGQQALNHLSECGECRLSQLIRHQLDRARTQWAAMRRQRSALRALFGVTEAL